MEFFNVSFMKYNTLVYLIFP